MQTVLLQTYLAVFSGPLALAVNLLFQLDTENMMNNPIMKATSPSDFWGRRWNLVVHGALMVSGVFLEYCPEQAIH